MLAYILDSLAQHGAAFAVCWGALIVANVTMLISGTGMPGAPVMLGLVTALQCGLVLMCAACWATLQFRFAVKDHRAAVAVIEKFLLGACGPLAGGAAAWALLDAVGPEPTPFYLAAVQCGLYELLCQPRVSSFLEVPEKMDANQRLPPQYYACAPPSARLGAALAVFLPAGLYGALHWSTLFGSWGHAWALCLLVGGPLCYLFFRPGGLWWLFLEPRAATAVRVKGVTAATGLLCVGLVGRVFLPSFGMYLRAPWPYNVVQVSLLAFGGWVAGAAFLAGFDVRGFLLSSAGMGLTVAGAVAVGATLGVPVYLLPLPAVAAVALCFYAETFAVLPWLGFMGAGGATMLWFVEHHFGFLEIDMGGVSVKLLCWALVAVADLSMAAVGMVLSSAAPPALGLVLSAQAVAVMWLEELLYSSRLEYVTRGMYPSWMVVMTSALGLLVTARAASHQMVPPWARWVMACAHGAKLTMVLLPSAAGPASAATPAFLAAAAVSAPALLYGRHGAGASQPSALSPAVGLSHAVAVVLAVARARYLVFDAVALLAGPHPSEGLVLGALVLAMAAGLVPLVRRFYAHLPGARRAVALVGCLGALLVLLRPPTGVVGGAVCPRLPLGLCPRLWDDAHFPSHESDDAAIYGAADLAVDWPAWLLMGALLLGLAAMPGAAPRGRSRRAAGAASLTPALGAACLVGMYVAVEVAPRSPALQVGLFLGSLAASLLAVLLYSPLVFAPAVLPWLYLGWLGSLGVNLGLHLVLPVPDPDAASGNVFGQVAETGARELRAERQAGLLGAYALEAMMVAFLMNLRLTSALGSGGAGPGRAGAAGIGGVVRAGFEGLAGGGRATSRAMGFLGTRDVGVSGHVERMAGLGSASVARSRLHAEGIDWLAPAANVAAVLCFGLAVAVARHFTGGADFAVPVLAPVLLLLNQDGYLLAGLTRRRRYMPPVAAVSLYLGASALTALLGALVRGRVPSAVSERGGLALLAPTGARALLLYAAKEVVAVACTVPSHALLATYLWNFRWVSGFWLLLSVPLNAVTLVLSSVHQLTVMGALGAAFGCVQGLLQWHNRRRGQRLV